MASRQAVRPQNGQPVVPTPIPRSVPVVLGVVFCDACNQFLIFPFIPFLVRKQLELPADHPDVPLYSGLLAAAYLFGQFACSPFYGSLSERLGRRPVLLVCVTISTFFLLAFGFSSHYVLSVVLRLLQGAFAGALTVGKLYLADVSDASNEGRIFSFIGIAIGSGCIAGPAVGGYLADTELLEVVVPPGSAVDELVTAFPYLAPCLAGALICVGVFFCALFYLPESRPPVMKLFGSPAVLTHLAQPLLNSPEGAASKNGQKEPPLPIATSGAPTLAHVGSGSLLEAMTSHASRSSLVVMDEGDESNPRSTDPSSPPSHGSASPQPVSAVSLALKHSLSPKLDRANLFGPRRSRSMSPPLEAYNKSRSDATVLRVTHAKGYDAEAADGNTAENQRRLAFWIVQLACFLFTVTNVGLTEVLPVWLSTPETTGPDDYWSSGLGLTSSLIGNLQSTTGAGNIVLALFVTYRIINSLGPVRTFAISLFLNALAAFGPPLIKLMADSCPESLALGIMCVSYSLVAASRNMMFATAIMLSKEAAAGGPGVAIGINQSACSLGSAFGPMLTGFIYTQSLSALGTCVPFFVAVGAIGVIPGVILVTTVPPWPWQWNDMI